MACEEGNSENVSSLFVNEAKVDGYQKTIY